MCVTSLFGLVPAIRMKVQVIMSLPDHGNLQEFASQSSRDAASASATDPRTKQPRRKVLAVRTFGRPAKHFSYFSRFDCRASNSTRRLHNTMQTIRIEDIRRGIRSPNRSTDPCPFPCAPAKPGLCQGPLRTRPDDSHVRASGNEFFARSC